MDFGSELKKAMIDNKIDGAKNLSLKSDMSYNKVIRALKGDTSSRMCDVIKLGKFLGIELVFVTITRGVK